MQDHDLDDFVAFTDEEITAIAAFLHEERETASLVVLDETDTQEENDIDWDGEDNIGRSNPQMIPPLTAFYLEGLPKDIIDGFAALQETDEWKSADSYRRQINKYQTMIQRSARRRNGYSFRLSVLSNFDVVKSGVECDMKIFTNSVCVGPFFMCLYRSASFIDKDPVSKQHFSI
jgi:hypothetical protein